MTKYHDVQLRDVVVTVSSTDESDEGTTYAVTTVYKLEIETTLSGLAHFMRKVGDLTEVVHGPELMQPVV
jgi:hypothetical protein